MNDFKDIGKKLPYSEQEDYVEQLVTKATEQAIGNNSTQKPKMRHMYVWAAAAIALVLIAFGVTQFLPANVQQESVMAQQTEITDEATNYLDDELLLAYSNLSTEDQEYIMEVYEEEYFIYDINELNVLNEEEL